MSNSTHTIGTEASTEVGQTSFLLRTVLKGYADIEFTIKDGIDHNRFSEAFFRGELHLTGFGSNATCGRVEHDEEVIGQYETIDMSINITPEMETEDGWTLGYYQDGEPYAVAPSGTIHT